MKYYIPIIIFVLFNYSKAFTKQLYLETTATGTYVTFKSIKMNNGTKIIHYENDMAWTDNFGNYGSGFCYGSFISKNDVYTKFDLYCENKNQNGEYYGVFTQDLIQNMMQEQVRLIILMVMVII